MPAFLAAFRGGLVENEEGHWDCMDARCEMMQESEGGGVSGFVGCCCHFWLRGERRLEGKDGEKMGLEGLEIRWLESMDFTR